MPKTDTKAAIVAAKSSFSLGLYLFEPFPSGSIAKTLYYSVSLTETQLFFKAWKVGWNISDCCNGSLGNVLLVLYAKANGGQHFKHKSLTGFHKDMGERQSITICFMNHGSLLTGDTVGVVSLPCNIIHKISGLTSKTSK